MEKKFKRIEFILDNFTDKEIIEWLEMIPNRSMYIRDLIQQDIKKKKKGA